MMKLSTGLLSSMWLISVLLCLQCMIQSSVTSRIQRPLMSHIFLKVDEAERQFDLQKNNFPNEPETLMISPARPGIHKRRRRDDRRKWKKNEKRKHRYSRNSRFAQNKM
ncbi:unnamed protein product [Schistosoma turkestanicum]|nr:unnamed protein product [Schistosoma turkestanicum]